MPASAASHAANDAVRRAAQRRSTPALGQPLMTSRGDDMQAPGRLRAVAPDVLLPAAPHSGGEDLAGREPAEPGSTGASAVASRQHRFRRIKRFSGTVMALAALG